MGKAIERSECMECKRPVKCCDGGCIDMTIAESARILKYLDKSTYRFDDYFHIKTDYSGKFSGVYAKRKVIGKYQDVYRDHEDPKWLEGFKDTEVQTCIFFDPKKRLCEIHEVKPTLCATHVCMGIYHEWSDEQHEKLQKIRKEKGLHNESSIKYDCNEIINDHIIKGCLEKYREGIMKQYSEAVKKFKDFASNMQDILGLECDYDD